MLKLVFISGPNSGNEFVLDAEFAYLGREVDNAIVIDDAKLSRYHFCVAISPEGYEVIDNQSTNGTYLNGKRIEREILKNGDEIQAGNSLIRVEVGKAVSARVQTMMMEATGRFSIQSTDGNYETEGDYITVGRNADNHVHIDDLKASREHAKISYNRMDGCYYFTDNNSVNGTFLGEKRITEEQIKDGDQYRIGSYTLIFSFPTARILQINVKSPNLEAEYGIEAAEQVAEQRERQETVGAVLEYDLPKVAQEQEVLSHIPKELAEQASKQRYATLIVDSIPKAVLEAGKEAKEEKKKPPKWIATSDVINDGRRRWYVGGSVAATLLVVFATFLTGFHRPFLNRPLSKFHQSVEFLDLVSAKGLGSDCKACHTLGEGVDSKKCQTCHEVKWTQWGSKHHSNEEFNKTAISQGNGSDCIACHFEHKGVDARPGDAETLEAKCWSCHKNPEGEAKRGFHSKEKPKYTEVRSQETGQVMTVPGLEKALADNKQEPAAWLENIHSKHGSVPGYCNACHAPREVTLADGKKENKADPRGACLDCHQVAKEASCNGCHEQHVGNPRPNDGKGEVSASLVSKIPGSAAGAVLAFFLFLPAFVYALNKRRRGELIPINKEREEIKKKNNAPPLAPGEKVTVIIKKELCIGCSGCINSCPYDVLELNQETHKSTVVAPEKCLGDMRCTKACPTGACVVIKGDKIPEVDQVSLNEFHESNVPGLYVVGEASGKPLIKNAINQGKIAIDHIMSQPDARSTDPNVPYDVVIVGSGPGGLSASLSAMENGLKYLLLEKAEDTSDTIRNFPKAKIVLAEPVSIPLAGKLWMEDTNKESLIAKWEEIIKKTGLQVTLHQEAVDVTRAEGHFVIKTPKESFKARRVILAPGTRGAPNKIGCPGEEAPRVNYRLTDTDPYKKKHCLVLGGGDSAVEAAMSLADVGSIVTLAYRKEKFDRIKERNLERLLEYVKKKKVKLYLQGNCKEVIPGFVIIKHEKGAWGSKDGNFVPGKAAGEDKVQNDFVFALLGAQAPGAFFKKAGIEVKKVPMA